MCQHVLRRITGKVNGKCSNVHCFPGFPGNNTHAQNSVDQAVFRPGNETTPKQDQSHYTYRYNYTSRARDHRRTHACHVHSHMTTRSVVHHVIGHVPCITVQYLRMRMMHSSPMPAKSCVGMPAIAANVERPELTTCS